MRSIYKDIVLHLQNSEDHLSAEEIEARVSITGITMLEHAFPTLPLPPGPRPSFESLFFFNSIFRWA